MSLAALTLITEHTLAEPVLCVVDDAQWIDRESLEVINFIARRLQADRVVVLLAIREGEAVSLPDALPTLRVEGLSTSDAQALLATLATGPLSEAVTTRIVADTGGIPLALIELAVELSAEQLAGRDTLPEMLPIGERLHRHFRAQLRGLPTETQMLLLVAAAEPTGDVTVVQSTARARSESPAGHMTPPNGATSPLSCPRLSSGIRWSDRPCIPVPRRPTAGTCIAPWLTRPMPRRTATATAWRRAVARRSGRTKRSLPSSGAAPISHTGVGATRPRPRFAPALQTSHPTRGSGVVAFSPRHTRT